MFSSQLRFCDGRQLRGPGDRHINEPRAGSSKHSSTVQAPVIPRGPKLERPPVDIGVLCAVRDRLSGWTEVFGSAARTNLAGAPGLIRHLRSFFPTFGVPEELSSDGGPELP